MTEKNQNRKEKSLRDGFGEGIIEASTNNKKVWAVSADLASSNRLEKFKEKFPERFVEVGVAEQNMMGVAAGLAHLGLTVFTASFAVFSPGRNWDQIRVSVCYNNSNVKIYGGHAGLSVGEDGATHQALEDIAIMRCLPNIIVIAPCDAVEMKKAVLAAAQYEGPVYLRGGRPKIPVITDEKKEFKIGKAHIMRRGSDITIVACGIMVAEALKASEILSKKGISAEVINSPTIKPLDKRTIRQSALKTGRVLSVEEHQITGGLGSAVAEALADIPEAALSIMGVEDSFGESGEWRILMKKYGLTSSEVIKKAMKLLKK